MEFDGNRAKPESAKWRGSGANSQEGAVSGFTIFEQRSREGGSRWIQGRNRFKTPPLDLECRSPLGLSLTPQLLQPLILMNLERGRLESSES